MFGEVPTILFFIGTIIVILSIILIQKNNILIINIIFVATIEDSLTPSQLEISIINSLTFFLLLKLYHKLI